MFGKMFLFICIVNLLISEAICCFTAIVFTPMCESYILLFYLVCFAKSIFKKWFCLIVKFVGNNNANSRVNRHFVY